MGVGLGVGVGVGVGCGAGDGVGVDEFDCVPVFVVVSAGCRSRAQFAWIRKNKITIEKEKSFCTNTPRL